MSDTVYSPLFSFLRDELDMRKSRLETLSWLLTSMIEQRSVNLARLSAFTPSPCLATSTHRRFERFFQTQSIPSDWCARFCVSQSCGKGPYRVALDRTQWMQSGQAVNILVLCVLTRRGQVPVLWRFLPHRGSSNFKVRRDLIEQFLELFGPGSIADLLGDREFAGAQWLDYLCDSKLNFTIRVKSGQYISEVPAANVENQPETTAGPKAYPERMISTLTRKSKNKFLAERQWRLKHADPSKGHALFIRARKARSRSSNGDDVVVLTNHEPDKALKRYKARWRIETLFCDLKSRGFNLEASRMTAHNKLDLLMAILAIACTWTNRIANRAKGGPLKKKHKYKAKSWFRFALDKLTVWIRTRNQEFKRFLRGLTSKLQRVG